MLMSVFVLEYVGSFIGDTRALTTKEARSIAGILQMYYAELFGKMLCE